MTEPHGHNPISGQNSGGDAPLNQVSGPSGAHLGVLEFARLSIEKVSAIAVSDVKQRREFLCEIAETIVPAILVGANFDIFGSTFRYQPGYAKALLGQLPTSVEVDGQRRSEFCLVRDAFSTLEALRSATLVKINKKDSVLSEGLGEILQCESALGEELRRAPSDRSTSQDKKNHLDRKNDFIVSAQQFRAKLVKAFGEDLPECLR